MEESLQSLNERVIDCALCPRLVRWREKVAREKVRRFQHEEYWGRPVPGFGDPQARLLLVGLAPGAHGANRTGRMFTGDESGRWLYRALYENGFASAPESLHRGDGLRLHDTYITATLRCAPPLNKPSRPEIERCKIYLLAEWRLLRKIRVVVGLGRIGFDAAVKACQELNTHDVMPRMRFAHGAVYRLGDISFIASYHPSQQNTFTRRLTRRMFHQIFRTARRLLDG